MFSRKGEQGKCGQRQNGNPKRNLIRPSHATTIHMTEFARNHESRPNQDAARSTMSSDPSSLPDVSDVQTSGNSKQPEPSGENDYRSPEGSSSSSMTVSPKLTSSQNADLHSSG